jgi:hypothetical protein
VSAADERAHGEGCECVRCKGFQAGNEVAVKHGAYATSAISERAAQLADDVRAVMPLSSPADEFVVRALGIVLARVEAADRALAEADERGTTGDLLSLRQDLRRWLALELRYAEALGLAPLARVKLGLAAAQTRRLDLTKLSDRELSELEALVELAEEVGLDA